MQWWVYQKLFVHRRRHSQVYSVRRCAEFDDVQPNFKIKLLFGLYNMQLVDAPLWHLIALYLKDKLGRGEIALHSLNLKIK